MGLIQRAPVTAVPGSVPFYVDMEKGIIGLRDSIWSMSMSLSASVGARPSGFGGPLERGQAACQFGVPLAA